MAPRGIGDPIPARVQPEISFSSYPADVSGQLEDVYRIAPATGAITRLTQQPSPETESHRGGDWSPDRTRLVGWGGGPSMPGTRTQVIDAVGGATQAEMLWGDASPTWLDDETLLVLERLVAYLPTGNGTETRDVFAIDLRTWTVHQVTQLGATVTVHSLRWHPRGGLALDVSPDGATPWVGRRVAVVPAAKVLRAASGAGAPVGPRDLRQPFGATPTASPDWAPDGTRLAVVRMHADDVWAPTDIAVGSLRSGRLAVVVDGSWMTDDGDPAVASGYGMPAFSPDGTAIAWVEYFRDAWGEIWVADASGANRRQVTSFGHTEVVVSLDW